MSLNPGDRPASLTVEQATQIARQARRVKFSLPYGGNPRSGAPLGKSPPALGLIPAIVTTSISAASGTTVGTGQVQLYYLGDGATAATADADNTAVDVKNWYTGSGTVAVDTHVLVFPFSGEYWLAGLDC